MPTFGKTDAGSTSGTSTATKVAVSSASPSTTGSVISATAQVFSTSSNLGAFAVYADSGGSPGALLAVSDSQTLPTSSTQVTFTFSGANANLLVTAGVNYWIGPFWQTGATYGHDAVTGGRLEGTGWTWPTPTGPTWAASQSGPMAAYVTYLEPSGGRELRMTTVAVTRSYFY